MSTATETKPEKKPIVRMPDGKFAGTTTSTHQEIPVGQGKAKKEGVSTEDIKVEQPPSFDVPIEDEWFNPPPDIIVTPEMAAEQQAAGIAFGEEPVEIYIQPSSEEFGATEVPVWNQGKFAEVFNRTERRWESVLGIPRGVDVVTRVKYLETILRSKTDDVRHDGVRVPGQEAINRWKRRTVTNYQVQLLRYKNPLIKPWFEEMCRRRA